MKKIILVILIIGTGMTTFAQVQTRMFEKGKAFKTIP